MFLLLLSFGFAFAALDVFTEPWPSMDRAGVAETICGHLATLALSILCFRAALYFGTRAGYGDDRRLQEPEI